MKRISIWIFSTIAVLVLLFGYRTSLSAQIPTQTVIASSATNTVKAQVAASSTGTFTGTAVNTRWGPVQVRITVANGKITAVDVPEYPDSNGRDEQINARALPVLIEETISAQSANVDMVSGATYTSEGYTQSLQSAIDQAGVA